MKLRNILILTAFVLSTMIFSSSPSVSFSSLAKSSSQNDFVQGELIVQFENNVSFVGGKAVTQSHNLSFAQEIKSQENNQGLNFATSIRKR